MAWLMMAVLALHVWERYVCNGKQIWEKDTGVAIAACITIQHVSQWIRSTYDTMAHTYIISDQLLNEWGGGEGGVKRNKLNYVTITPLLGLPIDTSQVTVTLLHLPRITSPLYDFTCSALHWSLTWYTYQVVYSSRMRQWWWGKFLLSHSVWSPLFTTAGHAAGGQHLPGFNYQMFRHTRMWGTVHSILEPTVLA